ncbi:hypothetical protein ACFFRR_005598 [Megaselia abdita]
MKVPFLKIKNVVVEIIINKKVAPVLQSIRRIPIALQAQIESKLRELLDLDIIESVGFRPTGVPIVKTMEICGYVSTSEKRTSCFTTKSSLCRLLMIFYTTA